MTETLDMQATLLTASTDDRTLTYVLAPFGEPGRTSKGLLTLTPTSLRVPDDVSSLPVNIEHTRDGGYTIVEEFSTDEQYGFAVKKGNTALVDAVRQGSVTLVNALGSSARRRSCSPRRPPSSTAAWCRGR